MKLMIIMIMYASTTRKIKMLDIEMDEEEGLDRPDHGGPRISSY